MDPSTSQQTQHQQGQRCRHDRSGRGAGSGSADPAWRAQLAGLLASLPAGADSDLDPADSSAVDGAAADGAAMEGAAVEGVSGSGVVDVSGLPAGVGAAVAKVVQGFARAVAGDWPVPALRAPGRDGVGQEPLAEVADEHTPATATLAQGRQALAVIEAAEVAKAFLDAVAVEAAGVVATAYELHLNPAAGVPVGMARRAQLALAGRDGAAAEIQAATGMSATSARRLVRYARAGGARTATARRLLGEGKVSLYRATTLLERTADLSPEVADQVAAEVLRPLPPRHRKPDHPDDSAGAGADDGAADNDGGHNTDDGGTDDGGTDTSGTTDGDGAGGTTDGDGAGGGGDGDGDGSAGGGGSVTWCAPESGAGCVPISASTFYRRLKVSRARHGSDPARHEREVRGRGAGFELAEDGTACLWVTGDGPRVVAAHRRIDTMARAARRAGDPRTLDQLRSDLIVDLLLYGIVATDLIDDPTGDTAGDTAEDTTAEDPTGEDTTGEDTTERGAPERASTPTGGPPPGQQPPEHEPAGRGARVPFAMPEAPAPGPAQRHTWDLIGTPPPALVHVVVSLDTLTGTRPGVGELPGHGFLPADQTRQLCLAAGSTWRRLVTDPASGHLVELTSTSYQAPPALAAQVDARDHLCRGPGCTVPAPHCDFDHDTDHAAGGKTSTSNGSAKHRRHHNLKTRRLWHTRQHPDGTITWTTLLGRRYDTEPHDYHELHDPQDPHQEPTTTPPPTPQQEEPPF